MTKKEKMSCDMCKCNVDCVNSLRTGGISNSKQAYVCDNCLNTLELKINFNRVKNDYYYELGLKEGRLLGARTELEKIQEISFKDNLNKEQTLFEVLNYIGKRLKELEQKGVN